MRIIGLAGWSGAGKTTLLSRLSPRLIARGLSVSTIKHAHHAFDVDTPGKDSWLHREAGATEVLVASSARFALMHELRGAPEPELGDLLGRMQPVDLLLIEGFKHCGQPKIEVHRAANAKPFLFPADPAVAALATDSPPAGCTLPVAHLDDIEAIARLALDAARPAEAFARVPWPL